MAFGKNETDASMRRREVIAKVETRENQRMAAMSPILTVMMKAVQKAGRKIIRDFGELAFLQVRKKGVGDFVSETDISVEQALIESLKKDRPDYGFISEECGEIAGKEGCPYTFIIDPIDGTTNFIHAIPYFALSVALKERDEIVAGVIYNPVTGELYFAEKGSGAFVMEATGNKRLRVAGRVQLSDSLLTLSGLNSLTPSPLLSIFAGKITGMRNYGSTVLALASVASGQMDGFVGKNIKLWDLAAGVLFIREAGGVVATVSGKRELSALIGDEYVLACSSAIYPQLQKTLVHGLKG